MIYADDVERIFGKRPWQSRAEEIIEDNMPKLEDMPDEVKAAQAEHERNEAAKAQQDTLKEADSQSGDNTSTSSESTTTAPIEAGSTPSEADATSPESHPDKSHQ